jgi:MFS superfamily sulfate permease-like transporter
LTAIDLTSHRRFTVTVTGDAAQRVARASGPLFEAAEDLVETIVDHLVRLGINDIMLDLGAVTDIDTSAMQLLVDYRASLTAAGVAFTFDAPLD